MSILISSIALCRAINPYTFCPDDVATRTRCASLIWSFYFLAAVFVEQCADHIMYRPRKLKSGANTSGAARAGVGRDLANGADAFEEVRQTCFIFSVAPSPCS